MAGSVHRSPPLRKWPGGALRQTRVDAVHTARRVVRRPGRAARSRPATAGRTSSPAPARWAAAERGRRPLSRGDRAACFESLRSVRARAAVSCRSPVVVGEQLRPTHAHVPERRCRRRQQLAPRRAALALDREPTPSTTLPFPPKPSPLHARAKRQACPRTPTPTPTPTRSRGTDRRLRVLDLRRGPPPRWAQARAAGSSRWGSCERARAGGLCVWAAAWRGGGTGMVPSGRCWTEACLPTAGAVRLRRRWTKARALAGWR